jgi:hypothetical protein
LEKQGVPCSAIFEKKQNVAIKAAIKRKNMLSTISY